MIAVLGILCMFAFTFTGFVGGFGSGDGGGQLHNPVAVTSRFGDYHESDLRDMRNQRELVKNFLRQAIMLTLDPQMRPFAQQQLGQMLRREIGPSTESAVLETHILAQQAKQAGVVVSDDSVTDFLREQTGDQVRGEEFQSILANLSRGDRQVSRAMLYEAMRTELLSRRMREMFVSSLQVTPAQRWDFYQRLRRRIRVELAPVAAADFVSKVANPTDSVAQKYFDQYKDQEPQPGSPEPGFKIPHRAAFQYFEAHYQDFYHPEEIAEAEITANYEKMKDTQYLYNEMLGLSDEDEENAAENAAQEKQATENKPAENKAPDQEPGASKPPAEQKKEDAKPAEDKSPEDKSPEDKPAEDKDQDEPGSSGSNCEADNRADDEEPAAADDDKQSSAPDNAEKPAAAAEGQSPPSEPDKQPAANQPAGNQPAASQPADDTSTNAAAGQAPGLSPPQNSPAKDEPNTDSGDEPANADSKAAGGGSKPAGSAPHLTTKKSTAPPLERSLRLPRDITKGPNPKYEPLWQAEPKIRKALAGAKAVEQMDKALLGLKSKLRPYSNDLRELGATQATGSQRPTPHAARLSNASQRHARRHRGAEFPLSPDYQIAQVPGIGQSQVSGQPFAAFAATGLKLFHAVESQDNDGNRYLFWKTDDQEKPACRSSTKCATKWCRSGNCTRRESRCSRAQNNWPSRLANRGNRSKMPSPGSPASKSRKRRRFPGCRAGRRGSSDNRPRHGSAKCPAQSTSATVSCGACSIFRWATSGWPRTTRKRWPMLCEPPPPSLLKACCEICSWPTGSRRICRW